jgi:ribonuclease P protein component
VDASFPRAKRITKQGEIEACYRRGRRWNGKMMRIHARANELPHSRLAISIPGRVCNAVLRNRWKRLLRESFRLNQEAIGPGLDIVVVVTRPPESLGLVDVQAMLLDLVKRHRGAR